MRSLSLAFICVSLGSTPTMWCRRSTRPPGARLPELDEMLMSAQDKVHDFAETASKVEARVERQRNASREELGQQKAAYENQLNVQIAATKAIIVASDTMRLGIHAMQVVTNSLLRETENIKQENAAMHNTIAGIHTKVRASKSFIAESLRLTNDSLAEELNVLKPSKLQPTLENFLTSMGANSTPGLFIQVDVGMRDQSDQSLVPTEEELVKVLSQTLADITLAEKEGELELKAQFDHALDEVNRKRSDALEDQRGLNETIGHLKTRTADLQRAREFLLKKHSMLEERLQALQVWARNIDHLLLGPPHSEGSSPDLSSDDEGLERSHVRHKDVTSSRTVEDSPSVNIRGSTARAEVRGDASNETAPAPPAASLAGLATGAEPLSPAKSAPSPAVLGDASDHTTAAAPATGSAGEVSLPMLLNISMPKMSAADEHLLANDTGTRFVGAKTLLNISKAKMSAADEHAVANDTATRHDAVGANVSDAHLEHTLADPSNNKTAEASQRALINSTAAIRQPRMLATSGILLDSVNASLKQGLAEWRLKASKWVKRPDRNEHESGEIHSPSPTPARKSWLSWR